MKGLYAFFQSENNQVFIAEKELFHSIDKVYEVYLFYLVFIPELRRFAEGFIEDRRQKHLPTQEDLNPKLNFIQNKVIEAIDSSSPLNAASTKLKVNWQGQGDLIKKVYYSFKDSPEFRAYLELNDPSFKDDKAIIISICEKYVFTSEDLLHFLEERSIYWLDDIEVMQTGVIKSIKQLKETEDATFSLLPLHKEAEEDRKFATDLFRRTILHSTEFEKEIAERAQNWEIDRVAKMDIILMKMAICELTLFPSIPVKVTLDEYIELSKDYSSPQSKTFINGILDKLVADFKRNKRIEKAGRGLLE
jgi:N utilization substance protein B